MRGVVKTACHMGCFMLGGTGIDGSKFAKTLNPCKIERVPCFNLLGLAKQNIACIRIYCEDGECPHPEFCGMYSTWVRTMFDTGCFLNLPKPQTLHPGNLIAQELPTSVELQVNRKRLEHFLEMKRRFTF